MRSGAPAFAPLLSASSMVGIAPTMRWLLVISPVFLSCGTLKSTRISTRLSLTSMSLIDALSRLMAAIFVSTAICALFGLGTVGVGSDLHLYSTCTNPQKQAHLKESYQCRPRVSRLKSPRLSPPTRAFLAHPVRGVAARRAVGRREG